MRFPFKEYDRLQQLEDQYRMAKEALYEDYLRNLLYESGVHGYKVIHLSRNNDSLILAVPADLGEYKEERVVSS